MAFWDRFFGITRTRKLKRATRAAYAGAVTDRLTAFMGNGLQSPTAETRYELTVLRSRSRELYRNNPLIHRFAALHAENVSGRHGPALQARVTNRSGEPDENANQRIEDAWWMWGRDARCTIDASSNWGGFCQRVASLRAIDGEVFIRAINDGDNDSRFSVQLVDPDRVDDQMFVTNPDGTARIVQGVEIDRWGKPIFYHVLKNNPNELGVQRKEYEVVPAAQMYHYHKQFRSGQFRGVPDTAAVITTTQMLDGYVEAALVEARTAASKQGFIQLGPDAEGPDEDAPDARVTNANPGVIDYLGKDETFVGWDPKSPAGTFGPFIMAGTQWIAAGLNVSYMGLTGDLSNTSYSSSRTGLLQERDAWRIEQDALALLCDWVYRRWLPQARLANALTLPYEGGNRYTVVEWKGRSWDWVDPANDVNSAAQLVAYGFKSPQEVVAEQGKDLRDVYQQIAAANELAEELGLNLSKPAISWPPAVPEPAPAASPAEDAADDKEEVDDAAEDRKQVAKAVQSIDGAIRWIAAREQPAPVINVSPPYVDGRVGGPKPGTQFVVERNERGEITGAGFKEPADSVEA